VIGSLDIQDCGLTTGLTFANHGNEDGSHRKDLCITVGKTRFCNAFAGCRDAAVRDLARTHPRDLSPPILWRLAGRRTPHPYRSALAHGCPCPCIRELRQLAFVWRSGPATPPAR